MTAVHYINEDKSDMRGIKPGWYAIEDDGNLSSGPFSSLEECSKRITQPTNGAMASNNKLRRGPKLEYLSTDIHTAAWTYINSTKGTA